MNDLRLAVLKDLNSTRIENIIKTLKDDDVYDEFCDFYDKCEVLHIEIADSVRRFMVDFIIQYRLKNLGSINENEELDILGRVGLVIDILEKYLLLFDDFSDDEMIHLLLFLARITNVLRFNSQQQKKIPWMQLRFLMCIFVATKTDNRHTKYPIIDFFFQFLVDKDIILDSLRKLLDILKNESKNEQWAELKTIYKTTRYYYEMRKVYFHLEYLHPTDFDEYSKNEMILMRHCQQIGESLKIVKKLGMSKDESQNYIKTFFNENFISSFIAMRNTLSHAKSKGGDITNIPYDINIGLSIGIVKMDIIIIELINEKRFSIMDTYITKLIKETDSKKMLIKINQIDTCEINNWENKEHDNIKIKWLIELVTNIINSTLTHKNCQSNVELNKLANEFFEACDYFRALNKTKTLNEFIIDLQKTGCKEILTKLKYLKDNLGYFKSKRIVPFLEVIKKFSMFNVALLEVDKKSRLIWIDICISHNQIVFLERLVNKSNDYKIESFLEDIINAFDNLEERKEFEETRNHLLLKRQLYKDYKLVGDPIYIKAKWPINDKTIIWNNDEATYDDPLETILSKTKKNLPNYEVVKYLLDKIKLENRKEVVEKVRFIEEEKLKKRLSKIERELNENKGNKFEKEMAVLDGYEILKLLGRELVMEKNYMDFHCLLPMGRPLRNFLAHGDVYLDLFLTQIDRLAIVENQLIEIFDHIKPKKQLNPSVSRKEDLNYLKERFNRQRYWIKTFISPLKLSPEDRYSFENMESKEDFTVAMRARDVQGRTYVHYNLEKCDRNNKFLLYLIDKVTSKNEKQNEIYDSILEESKYPSKNRLEIILEKSGSIIKDYLIDFFINSTDKKQFWLCQVLSINCPEIKLFKQLFKGIEDHSIVFLKFACFYIQTEIVKYIIDNQDIIDKELANAAHLGIFSNNFQSVQYLLARGAPIFRESLIESLKNGNIEMIELLLKHKGTPDFSLIEDNSFVLFCDPCVCEYLVDKYPAMINYNNGKLLFKACARKSERLVRFLVEKGANINAIIDGLSVLMTACLLFDNFEIVKYLVEKGAKIESPTKINALIVACQNGNVRVAKYLLDKGANTCFVNGYDSPLNSAIAIQSYELTEELFKRQAKINEDTIVGAIGKLKPNFFKYLIKKDNSIGWVINSLNSVIVHENTDLLKDVLNYLEVKKHYLNFDNFKLSRCKNVFCLLFKYPYQKLTELQWSELLHKSLYFQGIEEMKLILSKGANINFRIGCNNETILHYFFFYYDLFDYTMLRFLLHSGADSTAKDKNQQTPIQIAAKKLDKQSYQKVLKIVLEFVGSQ